MNNPWPLDPALPHLARAVDTPSMMRVFSGLLNRDVVACQIDRVKYRPRQNATVSYALTLLDRRGVRVVQPVATRWCQAGDASRRLARAAQRPAVATQAGPAWSLDAGLDVFVAWAPNDLKLPALATLFDGERLRQNGLSDAVEAIFPTPAQPYWHQTTLVQWAPEHRVCAKVEVTLDDGQRAALFAKADSENVVETTFAVHQALHANSAFLTAVPVTCLGGSGLYWQTALQGQSLAELDRDLSSDEASQVGALMAAFHATEVPSTRTVTLEGMRHQRHEAAQRLRLIDPTWWPTLSALVSELDQQEGCIDDHAMATLHGDLHRGNLMNTAQGLAVIDLDSVRRGPAVMELGSWLADSFYMAHLAQKDPATSLAHGDALLRNYTACGGARTSDKALAWATAHQLLCQRAHRCAVNLKPGRYPLVPRLIQHALAVARCGSAKANWAVETA